MGNGDGPFFETKKPLGNGNWKENWQALHNHFFTNYFSISNYFPNTKARFAVSMASNNMAHMQIEKLLTYLARPFLLFLQVN